MKWIYTFVTILNLAFLLFALDFCKKTWNKRIIGQHTSIKKESPISGSSQKDSQSIPVNSENSNSNDKNENSKFQNTETFLCSPQKSILLITPELLKEEKAEIILFPVSATETAMILNRNRLRLFDTNKAKNAIETLPRTPLNNILRLKLIEFTLTSGTPIILSKKQNLSLKSDSIQEIRYVEPADFEINAKALLQ